jgi:hypothetical protein
MNQFTYIYKGTLKSQPKLYYKVNTSGIVDLKSK